MADANNLLTSLSWLLGEWRGYGIIGKKRNTIHKRYYFDLGGKFFVERTLAMFQLPNPTTDFEIHQDFIVFYPDENSGILKVKGFYVEGFVSSAEVELKEGGGNIVVSTTEVENAPGKMATRYSIKRKSENEYQATFEIAWPGKEMELSQKLTMQRFS